MLALWSPPFETKKIATAFTDLKVDIPWHESLKVDE